MVPFHSCGRFSIISLHMKDKFTAIIDPTPLPEWAARIGPYYYYLPIVQKIAKAFGRAMEVVNPAWNKDVYDWPQIYTQESYQKHLTGNFRYEYMNFAYIIIN